MSLQFRQGDVFLVQIQPDVAPPEEIDRLFSSDSFQEEKKGDDNRVILALGEVTGHHHGFRSGDRVRMFRETGQGTSNMYRPRGLGFREDSAGGSNVRHGVDSIPRATVNNLAQRRYVRVESTSFLEHDEHGTIEVPPGIYEVVIQREYTPGAPRQVLD